MFCFFFFISLTSQPPTFDRREKAQLENEQKDKKKCEREGGGREAGGGETETERQCRHVGFLFCSERPDNCTTVPHSTHSRISQQALQASLNKSRSLNSAENFTQQRCGKSRTEDERSMTDTIMTIIIIISRTFQHILAGGKTNVWPLKKKVRNKKPLFSPWFNCFCPRAAACSRPADCG